MKTAERQGLHPTIELGTPEFHLWQQYFEKHLGFRPVVFQRLLDKETLHMTVPEPVPMWFDPSFQPKQAETVAQIMRNAGGD